MITFTLLASLLLPPCGIPGTERTVRSESELARVPFRSEAGLILVDVRVDDSEPLTFLLDSGASNVVIEREVAERLGLPMGPERGRNPASKRAALTFRVVSSAAFRIANHEFGLQQIIAGGFVAL